MIQANELRFGNLIERNGLVISVIDLTHSWDNEKCIINNKIANQYNPIILTGEILEKSGWIWNESCKSYDLYGEPRMNMTFKNNSWIMFNYILNAIICDRINYLHQLQNLFFSLTGRELQIEF